MNSEKFIEYLDNPETLDGRSLEEIKGVLQEYPYFQTAHMLLIKTLSNLKDMRLNNQLKISSAHVGNREILFELVHRHRFTAGPAVEADGSLADRILREIEQQKTGSGEREGSMEREMPVSGDPLVQTGDGDAKSRVEGTGTETDEENAGKVSPEVLIIDESAEITETPAPGSDSPGSGPDTVKTREDNDLLEFEKSGNADDGLKNKAGAEGKAEKKNLIRDSDLQSEAHSFSEWLMMLGPDSPARENEKSESRPDTSSKYDLIDRFLTEKPRIEPRSPLDDSAPPVDMSAGSSHESDEFFTETLAKIYIQQKHYKKAIYAYEKLSLIYPEKYGYFADQIDEIKRLINQ